MRGRRNLLVRLSKGKNFQEASIRHFGEQRATPPAVVDPADGDKPFLSQGFFLFPRLRRQKAKPERKRNLRNLKRKRSCNDCAFIAFQPVFEQNGSFSADAA